MAGLMREDAARDAMKNYGFDEHVINETIKELVELYGVDAWRLIEDGSYDVLLNRCLEKQEEQARQVAEEQEEEMAEEQEEEQEQHDLVLQEQEQHDLVLQEQEQHVETDALSTTSEAVIYTSPAALQSGEALADYAHHPVEGAGWLSEEDTDPEVDGDGDNADDDDEMIQLTPEPLCEELEELLREVRGQKKRKRLCGVTTTKEVMSSWK